MFSQQAAPAGSGCALQSMFLANVVALVEKACQRRIARSTLEHEVRPCPGQQADQHEVEERTNQATGVHDRHPHGIPHQMTQSSHDQGADIDNVNDCRSHRNLRTSTSMITNYGRQCLPLLDLVSTMAYSFQMLIAEAVYILIAVRIRGYPYATVADVQQLRKSIFFT
jgi:hypothetical protein